MILFSLKHSWCQKIATTSNIIAQESLNEAVLSLLTIKTKRKSAKEKKAQLPIRDWMQFFPLSLRNSLSRQCGDNQCWIAFWQEPFQNGFQPVLNLEGSQQLLYIFQMGHQVEILKNDIAISSNSSDLSQRSKSWPIFFVQIAGKKKGNEVRNLI